MKPSINKKLPNFECPATGEQNVSLKDYKSKKSSAIFLPQR
jgi:alkyl hydroperoxide reductase subunit AhpC